MITVSYTHLDVYKRQIQNSPLLLIGNVIYLLVCSTLADAVKREHDLGIVGEAKAEVERSGSQKALLVIGACTWLAYDIMRQSRGIEA